MIDLMNPCSSRRGAGVLLVLPILTALSTSAQAGILARWAQYTAGSALEARVVTDEAACPALAVDSKIVTMIERAAPTAGFPVRICVAILPRGTRKASVEGQALPLPEREPRRIVVLGDTGCRLKGHTIQACDDPKAWPFPSIAAKAAAAKPDLVIHVGDYHYRESPCRAGFACAGSPHGDNWASWNADFYAPARPLLAAAPWIAVRGNHEECARGGAGWSRLLDPGAFNPAIPCIAHDTPFVVPIGGVSLVVFDVATAPDNALDEKLSSMHRAEFEEIGRLAPGPSWLLMHRPIRGIAAAMGGLTIGGNITLINASSGQLPPTVELLLSGHIHTLQVLNYEGRSPPQLIVGAGGDLLDEHVPTELTGREVGGLRVENGFNLGGFGFVVFERGMDAWTAAIHAVDGRVLRRCAIRARQVACGSS